MTVLVGAVLSMPGVLHAELLGRHMDFVWIDLEHGALGPADMQAALIGLAPTGAAAFVRVPHGGAVTPALDAGAAGIVFPRVRSAADARCAARSLRHAPEGTRGYGPRRLAALPDPQSPSCVVQIEDEAGVRAAGDIAAVEGVDALVVGVADLSFELGEPLEFGTPPVTAALEHVEEAARGRGIAFGVAGMPAHEALALGADFVVIGVDVRLLDTALREAGAFVREAVHG